MERDSLCCRPLRVGTLGEWTRGQGCLLVDVLIVVVVSVDSHPESS